MFIFPRDESVEKKGRGLKSTSCTSVASLSLTGRAINEMRVSSSCNHAKWQHQYYQWSANKSGYVRHICVVDEPVHLKGRGGRREGTNARPRPPVWHEGQCAAKWGERSASKRQLGWQSTVLGHALSQQRHCYTVLSRSPKPAFCCFVLEIHWLLSAGCSHYELKRVATTKRSCWCGVLWHGSHCSDGCAKCRWLYSANAGDVGCGWRLWLN